MNRKSEKVCDAYFAWQVAIETVSEVFAVARPLCVRPLVFGVISGAEDGVRAVVFHNKVYYLSTCMSACSASVLPLAQEETPKQLGIASLTLLSTKS